MPRVSVPYRFDDGCDDEAISDAAPDTLSEGDAGLLLSYLRSAERIVAAPGVIDDPFVPGNPNARVRSCSGSEQLTVPALASADADVLSRRSSGPPPQPHDPWSITPTAAANPQSTDAIRG